MCLGSRIANHSLYFTRLFQFAARILQDYWIAPPRAWRGRWRGCRQGLAGGGLHARRSESTDSRMAGNACRVERARPDDQKTPTSRVAALVLARTMQRVAADRADLDGLVDAIELENRALAAIKLHLPVLPPKKPRQLRLPGL